MAQHILWHRDCARMIERDIKARGINDPAVLAAMAKVPRHEFMDEAMYPRAYMDAPVPIGHGQTVSQPYVVALMSHYLAVKEGIKILEIGTGSGYQTAVLAEMGAVVYSVERIKELYLTARKRLTRMRYIHTHCKLADGTLGWSAYAPYDRIIVTAGGPKVPEPLLEQLADPGLLLIPVGSTRRDQQLTLVSKNNGKISTQKKTSVAFVDLIGTHGHTAL